MTSLADLRRRATAPVDIASLAAFRVLFGLLMFGSIARFAFNGWIDVQYVRPTFFFKYWGFAWVPVPPAPWIYIEFGALALLALAVAAGLFYRIAIGLFLLGFLHIQLMDVTNYLNHYYLVVLLLVVLAVLPANAALSLDAWRKPELRRDTVPAFVPGLLRFQVGIVYFFAALAKLQPDWLLHGQPLGLWLRSRTDLPVLGLLFAQPWAPLAMSWAGFLFDLTVVGWMLGRRTRPYAYAVILVFHGVTHALFDIGMFPFIMPVATTVFFDHAWPRRLLSRWLPAEGGEAPRVASLPNWAPTVAAVWCALHLLMPLRTFAYGTDVLWAEEGMRFSWRVMVREKSGAVTFHVRSRETGRLWQVNPSRYLNPRQVREMATQPDLIWQLARHIAAEFESRHGPVEVRAETMVSLNGRAPAPLVDPTIDLSRVDDGLGKKSWILPHPGGAPAPSGLVVAKSGNAR
jgi:vitamin K-dependent gamma-carboxylase